ncbi:MAG: N-acetylmuramoyl-L-alanine amidase [Firmicutes bacterium]|nr:N-acetylmuramoyl-L-alanine amidase [Bacillota bacterium]
MQIIESGLQFEGLWARSETSLIVLHHSASADVTAAEIHKWHRAKGWSGIGYHFVIRKDGSIERGRPQEMIGAHAGAGVNGHSIGICLCGNFMQQLPSGAQLVSLVELVVWLRRYYRAAGGSELEIKLHREVGATQCPGTKFPARQFDGLLQLAMAEEGGEQMEDWKAKIIQQAKDAGLIRDDHHPDEPAPKWFVLTVALNAIKLAKS